MAKGFLSKLFGGGDAPSRERTLVRRDDLFRSAFEQAPVGIAFAGTDGQWLQFNDRFVKLLGYTADDLLRTSMRELTHAEDRKLEAPYVRKLTTGEIPSYTIEKRLQLRNQKYATFRVSVSRCSKAGDLEYYEYIVAPSDTTAPREGSGWLERVIEQVDDLAVIRSTQDGTISGWSRGAETIFGYKAKEVLTRSRSMLYRDADAFEKKHEEELRQVLRSGLHNIESWRARKDGFAIWTHVTLVTAKQDDGRVEVVEIVRQPSHLRSNPAHEAYRKRTEQLLSEARTTQETLQQELDAARASIDQHSFMARREVENLQQELERTRGAEKSLKASLTELRGRTEETFRESKIMAEALKKEIGRRRGLERLLEEARSELAATNQQWKSELDRFIEQHAQTELPAPIENAWHEPDFDEIDRQSFAPLVVQLGQEKRDATIICRNGSVEIRVHMQDGAVIACTSNQSGMPIGEMLVDDGLLTDDQRNRALELQAHTRIAFGRVLLLLDLISEEQLLRVMTERTHLELAQLFSWPSFEYAVVDVEMPAVSLVPLRLAPEAVIEHLHSAEVEEPVAIAASAVAIAASEAVRAGEPASEVETVRPVAAATATEEAPFIGNASKRARKVHRATCRSAAKIPASGRVLFGSIAEAEAAGFELCSVCMKAPKPKKGAAAKKPRGSRKKSAADEVAATDVN